MYSSPEELKVYTFYMELFVEFSLIRISAALLIFKWPLFGVLLSALLDGYDWDYLHTARNFNYDLYQAWDKAMDVTYLTVAIITARRWKDKTAKKIAVFFYFLRTSGVLLYFLFHIKPLLFFFPNIFENFFIWYLLFTHISRKHTISKSGIIWGFIILCIAIPKIIHEYVMHIRNVQLWYIVDFNFIDKTNETLRQYTNWLGWGSIFYIIPFITAILIATRYQKRIGEL